MTDPIDFTAAEAVAVSAVKSPQWALGFVDAHEHGWMTTDQLSNLAGAYLALVKDRERLDWFDEKRPFVHHLNAFCPDFAFSVNKNDDEYICGEGSTIRAAIDAAMEASRD